MCYEAMIMGVQDHIVEMLDCRRRVVENRQRIQVSVVCLPGDIPIAEKIRHSLPHRNPLHDTPVLASDFLSDFEFLGIINHHLHPKNRTGFIAHFQPVLFNTMYDTCPGNSFAPSAVFHIGDDFA